MKTSESRLPGSPRETFPPPLLKHTQLLLPENMNQEAPGTKRHHWSDINIDVTAHVCPGVSFGSPGSPGTHVLGARAVYVCLTRDTWPLSSDNTF